MSTLTNETILYINQYYEKNIDTGVITTSYYLGGKLIAQRENTTLRYIHQDSLSSTSLMTDSNGTQTGSTMKYLPYGATLSGSVSTDKKFTGQRLDDTGLYYYGARYYDAGIGRFISADTIVQNYANPQTLNRYSYCLNNPLKYTDPSGHVIDCGGNKEIEDAWALFAETCPDTAGEMQNSAIVYHIGWGSTDGSLGITSQPTIDPITGEVSVNITFNQKRVDPEREGTRGIAWVLSHEVVHAYYYLIDPNISNPDYFNYPSCYEEAIALQFQDWFGQQIDYQPKSHWFWEAIFHTSMMSADDVVRKARKVDLSPTAYGTESQRLQMISAFQNTDYANLFWAGLMYPPSSQGIYTKQLAVKFSR